MSTSSGKSRGWLVRDKHKPGRVGRHPLALQLSLPTAVGEERLVVAQSLKHGRAGTVSDPRGAALQCQCRTRQRPATEAAGREGQSWARKTCRDGEWAGRSRQEGARTRRSQQRDWLRGGFRQEKWGRSCTLIADPAPARRPDPPLLPPASCIELPVSAHGRLTRKLTAAFAFSHCPSTGWAGFTP
jgi:hypothetical protein